MARLREGPSLMFIRGEEEEEEEERMEEDMTWVSPIFVQNFYTVSLTFF